MGFSSATPPTDRLLAAIRGAVGSQPGACVSRVTRGRPAGRDSRLRRWLVQSAVVAVVGWVVCGVLLLPHLCG